MSKRVIRVIENVHMGLGHHGLNALAQELGVNTAGEKLLVFVNRAGTKIKVLGGDGEVVAYRTLPKGSIVSQDSVHFIAQVFGATTRFRYSTEARGVLREISGRYSFRVNRSMDRPTAVTAGSNQLTT